MTRLIAAVILTIALFGAFVFGLIAGQTGILMAAFCAWTPAAWFLGYTVARAGIRVYVNAAPEMPMPETRHRMRANGAEAARRRAAEDFTA